MFFRWAFVCVFISILFIGPAAIAQSPVIGTPDATIVQGINAAGTIRVNNLACLEALVNIFANGFEALGIVIGFGFLIRSLKTQPRASRRQNYKWAALFVSGGLAMPSVLSWLLWSAAQANLFI